MPFRYLKDPLFLVCFVAYWSHRLLATCNFSPPFFRYYLNDLICIPFWIPPMLWAMRRLGCRDHDLPPQPLEIVIPLVLWSSVFEVLLPLSPIWNGVAVPDPNDVLCYAIGGACAARYWSWRYRVNNPKLSFQLQ